MGWVGFARLAATAAIRCGLWSESGIDRRSGWRANVMESRGRALWRWGVGTAQVPKKSTGQSPVPESGFGFPRPCSDYATPSEVRGPELRVFSGCAQRGAQPVLRFMDQSSSGSITVIAGCVSSMSSGPHVAINFTKRGRSVLELRT